MNFQKLGMWGSGPNYWAEFVSVLYCPSFTLLDYPPERGFNLHSGLDFGWVAVNDLGEYAHSSFQFYDSDDVWGVFLVAAGRRPYDRVSY